MWDCRSMVIETAYQRESMGDLVERNPFRQRSIAGIPQCASQPYRIRRRLPWPKRPVNITIGRHSPSSNNSKTVSQVGHCTKESLTTLAYCIPGWQLQMYHSTHSLNDPRDSDVSVGARPDMEYVQQVEEIRSDLSVLEHIKAPPRGL